LAHGICQRFPAKCADVVTLRYAKEAYELSVITSFKIRNLRERACGFKRAKLLS